MSIEEDRNSSNPHNFIVLNSAYYIELSSCVLQKKIPVFLILYEVSIDLLFWSKVEGFQFVSCCA